MSSDAAADPEPQDEGMTFWEHLDELRSRLFRMSLAAAAGAAAAWFVRVDVLSWLLKPFKQGWEAHFKEPPSIHFPDPAGMFIAYVKVSVIVGVVFALPIIFYQLWSFVAPGLYAKEKRFALPFVAASTLLFCTGVYLGMTYAFPAAFSFLLGISADAPAGVSIKPTIMVNDYVSFISRMLIAFGAVFELPVVVFFLSVVGIVNHRHLLKFFRYFVVLAFVAAAILTPPDLLSQIIMAAALIFLYCISIGIAWIFAKNRPT